MKVNYLKWDSDFFDIDVYKGRYNHNSFFDFSKLRNGLTYLFSEKEIIGLKNVFYDQKVTFIKKIKKNNIEVVKQIFSYSSCKEVSKEILNLSYQSGEYSRFKRDPKIPSNKFLELYYLWIINSVNRSISDEVYTYKIEGVDVGMITIKKNKKTCRIGLVAVDNRQRGNNIGQNLMLAAEKWALENGCNEIEVETQENNFKAMGFYKKMNYKAFQKEYIYHLWK